jgi:hydroxylamine dehydrogenase
MAGGGDYGVFEIGRYQLTRSILEMQDWLDTREMIGTRRTP